MTTSMVPANNPVLTSLRRAGVSDAQLAELLRDLMPQFRQLDSAERAVSEAIDRLHATGITNDVAWGLATTLERHLEEIPGLGPIVARLHNSGFGNGAAKVMALELERILAESHPAVEPEQEPDTIDTTATVIEREPAGTTSA